MKVTKDDVIAAIDRLEKGETSSDLNSANGAADGDGDDDSLKAPGTDMNDSANNKKGKGDAMKSQKPTDAPEDFAKSLPAEVETKVDVSEFLKSLIDHNAQCMDGLRDYVVKSSLDSEDRHGELDERIGDVQKSLSNVGVVLKAICERIGIIENKTETRKSATSAGDLNKSVDRPFVNPSASGEADTAPAGEGLYKSLIGKSPHVQKSMVSEALCALVIKGEAKDTDVINFETYSYLTPELDSKLRAVL